MSQLLVSGVPRLSLVLTIAVTCLQTRASADSGTNSNTHIPIAGGWSDWKLSQQCTVSCGKGVLLHGRICNNPPPQWQGKNCTGSTVEKSTVSCNSQSCPFSGYGPILQQMNVESSTLLQNISQSLIRLSGTGGLLQAGISGLNGFSGQWATCTAQGDPHYRTFDGKCYTYMTSCFYYAVYDRNKSNTYPRFSVIIETGYCGSQTATCVLRFVVFVAPCDPSSGIATSSTGNTITFSSDGTLLKDDQDISHTLPDYLIDSLTTISRSGGQTTLSSACYGIEAGMNGPYNFYVRLTDSLQGQVLGLCGTFDGNANSDFTLKDGRTTTTSIATFANDYQLPSRGSGCVPPPLPPSCSTPPDPKLCDAMNRGNFAVCNDPNVCSSPVSPNRFVDNCLVDVCQCPISERERCACDAYIPYAVECREKCSLQIDLTVFPGCEVPLIQLQPSVRSIWQGYPTAFQCVAISGYPTAPLEFYINGKDIDCMYNASVKCVTTTNCTLLIHRAMAGTDNGTISCCMNNVVGEDCKTAQLIVKVGSFSVRVSSRVLVGSQVYPQITKIPSDNPVQQVMVELVTVNKKKVTDLNPSVPAQGKYQWDVRQLPQGAKFGVAYRVRVWDRRTQFEGFSNSFTFIRDVIRIDVPVDRWGHTVVPPLTYLGQKTRFAYDYARANVFMKTLSVSVITGSNSWVDNVGTFNAPQNRRPALPSWIPGTSVDLPNDVYRLYAKDKGKTGAEGTSNWFTIKHGSLCLVVPGHVRYGTIANVFGKVEPKGLPLQLSYHVVQADDCQSEVADVTGQIQGWPHAIWKLSAVIDRVDIGQPYRLRSTTSAPTYLQACSENTLTFSVGRISVSIAKAADVVYVDQTYAVTFSVPRNLVLVSRVSVTIHCYGTSKTWNLASAVPKTKGTVWWQVGHEELKRPVVPDSTCYVSVYDVGKTGATGRSQNVTVTKACVITEASATTGELLFVGVQFRPNQDLSTVSVQLVSPSNTSNLLLHIPSSGFTVGDNMLTIQHARVPDLNGQPTAGPFLVRVFYPSDGIAGYSDPVTFWGWSLLEVDVVDDNGQELNRPISITETVKIKFSVPKTLKPLAGSIGYELYLQKVNATGLISLLPNGDSEVNCTSTDASCSENHTVTWTVGKVSGHLQVGRYIVVVRDIPQQGGSLLIEGQSQEVDIVQPQVNLIPDVTASPPKPIDIKPEIVIGKPPNSKPETSTGDGGLSGGTIAGIVVALAVVVVSVLVVILLLKRRRSPRSTWVSGHPSRCYGALTSKQDQEEEEEQTN